MLWYNRNMAKTSKAQLEAQKRYDKKNTLGVYLKLNTGTDADVIQKLENVPSKQAYIKGLIRADIQKEGK